MSTHIPKQGASSEEEDLFADLNIRENSRSHQRVSSVPSSSEHMSNRWQNPNQRMVNSVIGNLTEISLKSNDVSPTISNVTTTQTSAFNFISNPASKKSPRTNEKIPSFPFIENSTPRGKSQLSLNNSFFNQLPSRETLAFAVEQKPSLKSQAQNPSISQRPISNSSNSMKARLKSNKVSLEELNIDVESDVNTTLNSPPPLEKNDSSKSEFELSRLEKELQQIIDIQSDVYQRRNSIYEQLAENFGKVKSLEMDQTNALSNEDYARADRLTREVQETHRKINNLRSILPGLDQTLNELREKQVGYLKSKADTCRILEKELKTKKNESIEIWKTYSADMDNLRTMETKQMNAMREEIGKARSEIVFDKDLWNNNETELNEKIEERCRDEKSESEDLSKKRENIRGEIKELMLRIERLRTEEDNYSQKINEIDIKIKNIADEYSSEKEESLREKNELDNRERDVENKSRHVEEMENQLHRKLNHFKEQHELSQKELASLEKRIEDMGSMSKIHREEAIEIEKLIDHLRDRAQRDLDCEKDISEIHVQMEECDIEVKKLTSKVMHDKQTYSNVQQDISTIDTQIPALEEQKKLAVAGRDFKSASRLANRIKDLQSTRDERTKFLETKCVSLERDQENLKMARKKLEEHNFKFIEVEKNTGSNLFEELSESLLQLRSRYDVANQRNFRTLMSLLQKEIKGLENHIDQIKVRYGLSNSNVQPNRLNDFQETEKSNDSNGSTNLLNNNSSARLEELEAQLKDAVDREDYVLAEKLNTQIKNL